MSRVERTPDAARARADEWKQTAQLGHPGTISTYIDTGAPCPTVNLNPGPFADEVIGAFNRLVHDLKHPDVQLRANFRRKFLVSYGIDIEHEPL
jgi:hypothetical protein